MLKTADSRSKTIARVISPERATRALIIGDDAGDADGDLTLVRRFLARMVEEEPRILGFPGNLDFKFSDLGEALDVLLNNVGDPTSPDASDVHTKPFEIELVRFLARIAGGDPDETYGYVTSGGTEANLFGLHLARNHLPDAPIYCSEHAHYSIRKAADVLRMPLVEVPAAHHRGINIEALAADCAARPGRGAIVVATVGTTMHGAIDDVSGAREAARRGGEVYVHVDAASGGLVAAFAPDELPWGFDAGADSITISGHKLIGAPVPCGVALARSTLVDSRAGAEYTGATDSTLSCSRSGLAALLLWTALRRRGRRGLEAQVRAALNTAAYAEQRLRALGRHPWRHPASLTIAFDRPSAATCAKWHLPTVGNQAHIVTVPHVTPSAVDELCADIQAEATSSLASRPAFTRLDAATEAQLTDWLTGYISRPQSEFGRPGAICPFTRPAMAANQLEAVRYRWPRPSSPETTIEAMIEAAMDAFEATHGGTSTSALRSMVVVVSGMDENEWWLIDHGHARMKHAAVRRGLMLGQFHPRCDAPAAHNPWFRASRSPFPLIAVRNIALHDVLFLHEDPEWFEQYRRRFGHVFLTPGKGDRRLSAVYHAADRRWTADQSRGEDPVVLWTVNRRASLDGDDERG